MRREVVTLPGGAQADLITCRTLVIGSGAAAMNCAEHLSQLGAGDVVIATDRLGSGASNCAGSDRQTCCKGGLPGDTPDSPIAFAHSLFDGGMMHGDIACLEALGNTPEFSHLVRNGVQLPHNRQGTFVGYETGHDPRQRAASAGPQTSMQMFANSLEHVRRSGVPILDRHEIVALLTTGKRAEKRVVGAVALNLERLEREDHGIVIFGCENEVMATGGPGEMYEANGYPPGQVGSHGLALAAGAVANNLGESQYGLWSTGFCWNLSGAYQEVVPCYFSANPDGGDVRYFLNDYYDDMGQLASNIFLKGCQWPFHAARLQGRGSSIIDYAVFKETEAGRIVYVDFARNPVATAGIDEFSFDAMSDEARGYLERSGALQATPVERLRHMNPQAIDVYADNGVDITREPLRAAVCAQHNSGGLRGDIWWQSNLQRLFPIGELSGSQGVQPGGSTLNSGLVGGLRAAQYIAHRCTARPMSSENLLSACTPQIESALADVRRYLVADANALTNEDVRNDIQRRMTRHGAFLRAQDGVAEALSDARRLRRRIAAEGIRLGGPGELNLAFQNELLCLTHVAFLTTIRTCIERGGGSRGGYLIAAADGNLTVKTRKGSELPHRSENMAMRAEVLETILGPDGEFHVTAVPVRPMPEDDSWCETTWQAWREGRVFDT